MKNTKSNGKNTKIAEKKPNFEELKRNFEKAYRKGEYAAELQDLSAAIARAVVKKVVDPQRKNAVNADRVSDSGYNPAIVRLRRELSGDIAALEQITRNNNIATHIIYTAGGDIVIETADAAAADRVKCLIADRLGDGLDLAQTAALALLEQAADHAAAGAWLDKPYIVRKLSKRVYIQSADSVVYTDCATTPIQEAFRAVRREIMRSRAVKTDPRNGYSYLSEYVDADGNDLIYIRLSKYADIGGETVSGGLHTVSETDAARYDDVLRLIYSLNLTQRQREIIARVRRGESVQQIAAALCVTARTVRGHMTALREACKAAGITPYHWTATDEIKNQATRRAVAQYARDAGTKDWIYIASYASAAAAEKATGIGESAIRKAADLRHPERRTAGGYKWAFIDDISADA